MGLRTGEACDHRGNFDALVEAGDFEAIWEWLAGKETDLSNMRAERDDLRGDRALILSVLNEVEYTISRKAQRDVGEVAIFYLKGRDGDQTPVIPQGWIEFLIKLRTALDECPMLEIESQKQCDRKCPVDPCMT